MSGYPWLRLWNDFADDMKLFRAAELAGAPLELVEACCVRALIHANKSPDRGSLAGLDIDWLALTYKQPRALIEAIFAALERVCVIADGRFRRWHDRQPEAAPARPAGLSPAAMRQKRRRDRLRGPAVEPELPGVTEAREGVTARDTGVTPGVTRHADVTPGVTLQLVENTAMSRDVTPPATDSDSDSDPEEEEGFVREGARTPAGGSSIDQIDQEFVGWWSECQNRVGEAAARLEYRRARQLVSAGELLLGWRAYAAAKPDDRHWLNPANWLRERRWTDQPAIGPPPAPQIIPLFRDQPAPEARHGRNDLDRSRRQSAPNSAHRAFAAGVDLARAAVRHAAGVAERGELDPGGGPGLAGAGDAG